MTLEVNAADAATEIFLIDGRLRRIAKGVGWLGHDVAPGFYKLRYRSAATQVDELIEVTGETERHAVHAEPIAFRSAAPLAYTATANVAQLNRAQEWSHMQGVPYCSLFLFLRQEDEERQIEPVEVQVLDLAGELIAGLNEGMWDEAARCAGLTRALPPGTYRVRVVNPVLGTYEMFVSLCDGWQTQVFLTPDVFERNNERVTAVSLRRSSIFMARTHEGFDPYNPNLRLGELAKHAISQGRNVVSREVINSFLDEKFKNPMLGFAVAHLLMRRPKRNYELLDTVLCNLKCMTVDHPDLEALELGLRTSGYGRSFELSRPPMFLASWDFMVRATRARASLIHPASVPGQIAHNVASSAPWLLHRLPDEPTQGPVRLSLRDSEALFNNLLSIGADELLARAKEMREGQSLSGLEQNILNLVLTHQKVMQIGETARFEAETSPGEGKHGLSRALRRIRAPAYSVASAVQSLCDKMKG
ncbi:hypothetical protein EBB79_02970 [Parasedimentitalea marina]|uniref:Uncharacterized protein n=1 Tax=Parasedimentitalea marina TaxID=2483033 RepID=A0A3T0MYV9_9RHOB|nr:hypothetical protein EBB79_02970 [Parasedimentitalea marina]